MLSNQQRPWRAIADPIRLIPSCYNAGDVPFCWRPFQTRLTKSRQFVSGRASVNRGWHPCNDGASAPAKASRFLSQWPGERRAGFMEPF